MKNILSSWKVRGVAACLGYCVILTAIGLGCAHLQPGADPFVVRAEQAEQASAASFDMILQVENTDRTLWASKAPAFAQFCVWLRQPITIEGTNVVPRAVAMPLQLDDIKNQYKASTITSNQLFEAILTLEAASVQAASWANVLTNNVP